LESVIGVPGHCKKVRVGDCGMQFVQADNEDKLCFENQDVEYNTVH